MALSGDQITRVAPGGSGKAYAGFSAKEEQVFIANAGLDKPLTKSITSNLTTSLAR